MSPPEAFHLSSGPITAHSFSPDRSQVVICENDNNAKIYSRSSSGGFELQDTLSEHDKLITSIDWAPRTNRIVTCSQDRNAYVWSQTLEGVWKPTLVLLRINRAATCVKWSPNEDKFAVGSGARIIAVCSFDAENNWWVAKHLKKPIRSTVLSIDWHPNNILLASGSADMKARVFSAWIKDVESRPSANIWGAKLPFNAVCGEWGSMSGGWVHDIAFSPSGDAVAFCSHDSTVTIIYADQPDSPPLAVHTIRSTNLPYTSLLWLSESSLVAAGHDCQPFLLTGSADGGWKSERSLDDGSSAGGGNRSGVLTPSGGVGRLNSEAFKTFRSADSRGASSSSGAGPGAGGSQGGNGGGTELKTVHQNTITSLKPYEWNEQGEVVKFSSSGVDGRLVIWEATGGSVGGITGQLGKLGF
ncbi:Actin-related protein Arp2/3 complex, subunit ARPC1/p41-ARC [Phaffia rhodozyma]|uniref:Actin-related protein 2/3 complex subunit n=1 Tax=Phaffia rhodozyma TaxID=264483 RepID=A0A0F7SIZ5_PHARH|nr:Actin-related protein Arp2/3 complex, subunit ARPC1/p41-ARC [Phaffia rhodozyma]